jgi:hypothetical protein
MAHRLGGFRNVQPAFPADRGHLVDDVLDHELVLGDVLPGLKVGPSHERQAGERGHEVPVGVIGRARSPGSRIRCRPEGSHGNHGQHAHDAPRECAAFEQRAPAQWTGIEAIGLGHFLAPAARANEISDDDAMNEHHGKRRRSSCEHMNPTSAERGVGRIFVQVADGKSQDQRSEEQTDRKRGESGKDACHALNSTRSPS